MMLPEYFGEWKHELEYEFGDIVLYDGDLYQSQCNDNLSSKTPAASTEYWKLMARAGSLSYRRPIGTRTNINVEERK